MIAQARIGLFDSGVGGLSILRAVRTALPGADLLFVADQAHVPYGPRSLEEVRRFSHAITQWLLDQGAQVIVVACNTASAAALQSLRSAFPKTPFVGMEPAVKPAAEQTNSGVVGVLATPATFQGALYASVVNRFAQGVKVLQSTCPGLVEAIEAGDLDGERPRAILEAAIHPMLAAGADRLVLGCTHYPFVARLIRQIAGPGVEIIDPAPAIARQTARILPAAAHPGQPGSVQIFTTGDAQRLQTLLPRLVPELDGFLVSKLTWQSSDDLTIKDGNLIPGGKP